MSICQVLINLKFNSKWTANQSRLILTFIAQFSCPSEVADALECWQTHITESIHTHRALGYQSRTTLQGVGLRKGELQIVHATIIDDVTNTALERVEFEFGIQQGLDA